MLIYKSFKKQIMLEVLIALELAVLTYSLLKDWTKRLEFAKLIL